MTSPPPTPSRSDAPGHVDPPTRGLPWAGLLAVLIILAVDRWALDDSRDWSRVLQHIGVERRLEVGLARDRVQLRKLDHLHEAYATALVLGNSRMAAGFQFDAFSKEVRGRIGKLAHAGFNPLELRSLLSEVVEREPTVVMLLLSEFDTHAPLRLTPQAMGEDLGAVWELALTTPPGFVHEHRTDLLRMVLVSTLRGYRLRTVLGAAGLDEWRRFATDERWPVINEERAEPALGRRVPMPRGIETLIGEGGVFPPEAGPSIRQQASLLMALAGGAQADVQMQLVGSLVAGLREAGVRVVILEGPLHPIASHLRQPALRAEFVTFMQELSTDEGVSFVPLTEQPGYSPAEFTDLTHLNAAGAGRLSALGLEQLTQAFAATQAR